MNERSALNLKAVNNLVRKNGVAVLTANLNAKNGQEVEDTLKRFGANAIPFYVVMPAGDISKAITLDGLITRGDVLKALEKAGPSKSVAAAAGDLSVRQTSQGAKSP